MQYGSSGQNVKDLQTKLNQLGFNVGSVDGMFGSGTKAAVMAFQTKHNLHVDGIVGSGTMTTLNAIVSPLSSAAAPVSRSIAYTAGTKIPSVLVSLMNRLKYDKNVQVSSVILGLAVSFVIYTKVRK